LDFSARGQIDCVFFQCLALVFGVFVLHLFAATHLLDRGFEIRLVRTAAFQGLAQLALVIECSEHEQLARYECVAALLRKLVGKVEQAREVVGYVDVPFLASHCRKFFQELAKQRAQHCDVDAGLRQQRRRRSALLVEQRHHQVRRFEQVVIAPDGKRLRIGERLLEARCQLVHSHILVTPINVFASPPNDRPEYRWQNVPPEVIGFRLAPE